jgi:hypothetical protein
MCFSSSFFSSSFPYLVMSKVSPRIPEPFTRNIGKLMTDPAIWSGPYRKDLWGESKLPPNCNVYSDYVPPAHRGAGHALAIPDRKSAEYLVAVASKSADPSLRSIFFPTRSHGQSWNFKKALASAKSLREHYNRSALAKKADKKLSPASSAAALHNIIKSLPPDYLEHLRDLPASSLTLEEEPSDTSKSSTRQSSLRTSEKSHQLLTALIMRIVPRSLVNGHLTWRKGDWIFDPMGGTGTLALAAAAFAIPLPCLVLDKDPYVVHKAKVRLETKVRGMFSLGSDECTRLDALQTSCIAASAQFVSLGDRYERPVNSSGDASTLLGQQVSLAQ